MKAVIYTRVSTNQQADSGLGLDAQREACAKWAQSNEAEVSGLHTDSGISGSATIDKRPGLLAAISEIRRGDVLLVAKRDRLGRDPILVAMMERMVQRKGGRVVSAAGEGTDDNDPTSILMRRIIDAFGEYEKLIIGARTKAALGAKRERGEKTGGDTPFGYTVAEDGKTLEPLEAETEVVELMLKLRSQGNSYRHIAKRLNIEGAVSRGNGWNKSSVHRIVTREASNVRN